MVYEPLKAMANGVVNELAKVESAKKLKKVGTHLCVIKYSDMDGLWYHSEWFNNRSVNLQALANKIAYMMQKGDGDNILPMLNSIAKNNIKTLYHVFTDRNDDEFYDDEFNLENTLQKKESFGKGHFRWDFKAYTLTLDEINIMKKYFGLC